MLGKVLICAALGICAGCVSNPPAVATLRSEAAGAAAPPAGCVADTATRIPLSARDCAAFGRTWTSEELRSTGATGAAGALRLLDPAITSSSH
jgi:hypothetical protein